MAEENDPLYRNMFERSVVGMYRTTADGRYEIANLALARMHGCDTVEEFKQTFGVLESAYARQEDRDRFVSLIDTKGEVHAIEFQGRRKDGSTFWFLESSRAIRQKDGRLLGYEGMVEEITDLRTVEQELAQAKRMAEMADRVKTELLSNVGHELRTPLNAIIGFSEMIQRLRKDADIEDEVSVYANEINESAARLLQVINALLEYSEINAGFDRQEFDDVDVIAMIHSVERRYAPIFGDKELRFTIALCRETPALFAEERALRRALENILSNAIKFTPAGGEVSLQLKLTESGHLRLQVMDTGIGLNEGDLAKALSPFEQVDASRSRQFDGMGLGLPMARSLVEQLGGEFAIRSSPGSGTVVTFSFPGDLVTVLHKV